MKPYSVPADPPTHRYAVTVKNPVTCVCYTDNITETHPERAVRHLIDSILPGIARENRPESFTVLSVRLLDPLP